MFWWCSLAKSIWWCFTLVVIAYSYVNTPSNLCLIVSYDPLYSRVLFIYRKPLFVWSNYFSSRFIWFIMFWIVSCNVSAIFSFCLVHFESFRKLMNCIINSFDSYHWFPLVLFFSLLIWFIILWIVSIFIWDSLIRFKYCLNCINLHRSVGMFLVVWIDSHIQWFDSLCCFGKKKSLATLFYIYSYPHNTQITESFADILSRVFKPHFPYVLQIKHFF